MSSCLTQEKFKLQQIINNYSQKIYLSNIINLTEI